MHTTQNLMVQGKNSESFAINYLEPFFNEKIDSVIDKIETFNQTAVKELSENSSSSNAGHTFKCALCDEKASKLSELKVHLKACHSKPILESPRIMCGRGA